MPGRVWVVSELYYPEETSTGHFLTSIAEGLASWFDVHVLCSQPTYSSRGVRAPSREVHGGVHIRRCAGTTFNKDRLPLRVLNLLTISLSIFVHALSQFRRGDVVIVVTNPPLLPFVVLLASRVRGARCLLLVHDVYPEALVAAGMTGPHSTVSRVIRFGTRALYRRMHRIITIGRDMQRLVRAKLAAETPPVAVIPNWSDLDEVKPAPKEGNALLAQLGLGHHIVIQYSGNMGRTHDLETLVDVARRIGEATPCHWLFIGWGAKRSWLEQAVAERGAANMTIVPPQKRLALGTSLTACDVSVIAFVPGMAGVSVPSRMYNVLAAGRPILALTDEDSELAMFVREHDVGWVVPAGDRDAALRQVERLLSDPDEIPARAARARVVAERYCSLDGVLAQYRSLIEAVRES